MTVIPIWVFQIQRFNKCNVIEQFPKSLYHLLHTHTHTHTHTHANCESFKKKSYAVTFNQC